MRLILKLALMTVACLALLLTLFSWPQRPALAPAQASSYTGLIPVSTGAPAPHLLTGAPAATQVASQRPLVEGTAVARVDFSANSGLITVPVRVNGSQKELRMYLDTGMSAPVIVLFHKESIAELGLTSTQQVFLGGAGGEGRKPAALAPGATVEIGPLKMPNQVLIVMTEGRETSEWPVDGIIGKSLFDRYLTEIDYEHSVLTLYEPVGAKIRPGMAAIPLDLATGVPVIEGVVELEGGKKVPLRFAADLGHRSALSLSEDAEKGVTLPKRTIRSIGGRGLQGIVPASIGRVTTLELGPFAFRDIPTAFYAPGTNPGLSREVIGGNVGSLVWRRFIILLHYMEKKMYLVPNPYFEKPFPFNMAGLFLEQNRDNIYFARHVIENSPASENGVQKGDKITAINGQDVRKYSYREILDIFNAVGRKVKLTIDRSGWVIQKTLKLRRLI